MGDNKVINNKIIITKKYNFNLIIDLFTDTAAILN